MIKSNKNTRIFKQIVIIGVLLVAIVFVIPVFAQDTLGTTFTYQGSISENGSPANGTYDLLFKLCKDAAGLIITGTNYCNDITITNGLFAIELNFGTTPFTGDRHWLALYIRPHIDNNYTNNLATYTALFPLQEITPAPYARYAVEAENLIGGINDADADPINEIQDIASVLTKGNDAREANITNLGVVSATRFTGNGSFLTDINGANIQSATITSNQIDNMTDTAYRYIGVSDMIATNTPTAGQILYAGSTSKTNLYFADVPCENDPIFTNWINTNIISFTTNAINVTGRIGINTTKSIANVQISASERSIVGITMPDFYKSHPEKYAYEVLDGEDAGIYIASTDEGGHGSALCLLSYNNATKEYNHQYSFVNQQDTSSGIDWMSIGRTTNLNYTIDNYDYMKFFNNGKTELTAPAYARKAFQIYTAAGVPMGGLDAGLFVGVNDGTYPTANYKWVGIGYDANNDYGFIYAANATSGWRDIAITSRNGGNVLIPRNNGKLYFGANKDAYITYNGSDLVISSATVRITGNVIANSFTSISNKTTSIRLDTNGIVPASAVTFADGTTQRTTRGVYSVGPSVFNVRDSGNRLVYGYSSNGNSGIFVATTGSNEKINAPVNLPHGAKVTKVIFYGYDLITVTNLLICLNRINFNGEENNMVAYTSNTDTGNYSSTNTIINHPIINNSLYTYRIDAQPQNGNWDSAGNLAVRAVVIEYTMEQ